jgi:hypothetical protein
MQDPGRSRSSDGVIAIVGCSYQGAGRHVPTLKRHDIHPRLGEKARQPVLVAASFCLFVQLAHLDGNYP